MRTLTAEPSCATEPIRIPGSIQPSGWMAILAVEDGHLIAHSENWPGSAAFEPAMLALHGAAGSLQPHSSPQLIGTTKLGELDWTCSAHQSGGLVILEFETLTPRRDETRDALQTVAEAFAPRLQGALSIQDLCALAAAQLKELSGFGRCLAYRFVSDGHGEVLAESADAGYESYLGHRFPASDVPTQARELYVSNQFRLISDANAAPVPLHCVDSAWTAQMLDLSMADLRSVSPIHIQYMRNMETLASMSVSIVVAGKLWGMISCHNRTSLSLTLEERNGCRLLGRLLSMQVEVLEGRSDAAERRGSRESVFQVLAGLSNSDATLRQLVDKPDSLLALVDATGVAVVHEDDCWSAGLVPQRSHILELAQRISSTRVHTFHVDRLVNFYPQAPMIAEMAAGVLAVSISRVRRHVVLWFRPEIIETVSWAGDPREKSPDAQGALSPRRSFTTWRQEVRGQCRRWSIADVASATEIRHALITLVLTRVQERELLTSKLALARRDIDYFTQSVSHELRQPLITAGTFGQLARAQFESAGDLRGVGYMERVLKAIVQTSAVSDAVLELARISRANVELRIVDISAMASQILANLQKQDPWRQVALSIQPGMIAHTDEALMKLVLAHLLGNAWKFTSKKSLANISVGWATVEGHMQWCVTDDGVGFDITAADRLFQPFHRFHKSIDFNGIGAGLALVNAAITRLGGTVRMETTQGKGATVYFTLSDFAFSVAPQAKKREGEPNGLPFAIDPG